MYIYFNDLNSNEISFSYTNKNYDTLLDQNHTNKY